MPRAATIGRGRYGGTPPPVLPEFLGRGRSGAAFLDRDSANRAIVRKVFESRGIARVLQTVFLGTPNPYVWCDAAVKTAVARRNVAADLVECWFGSRVRVARAHDSEWDPTHRAFALHTEYVDGRHAQLIQPFAPDAAKEVRELARLVLRPLQSHLREAGLDGLVWQAGHGNPVALGNFLLERDEIGNPRWVWIDLESGVPALFPANPLTLFTFYLPQSWRRRRPLFDDVDVPRLESYVDRRRAELVAALGEKRYEQLRDNVRALGFHQRSWRSMRWIDRSIACALAEGTVDPLAAVGYSRRPLAWRTRDIACGTLALAGRLVSKARSANRGRRLYGSVRSAVHARAGLRPIRFFVDRAVRTSVVREWIAHRIDAWHLRGQLESDDALALHADSLDCRPSGRLPDLAAHLSVSPPAGIGLAAFTGAVAMAVGPGWVDAAFALVAAPGLARAFYTLTRILRHRPHDGPRPWVALFLGIMPGIGRIAYVIEMLRTGEGGRLPHFLLQDAGARAGRLVPVWGGQDTMTEHLGNHLADRIARRAGR